MPSNRWRGWLPTSQCRALRRCVQRCCGPGQGWSRRWASAGSDRSACTRPWHTSPAIATVSWLCRGFWSLADRRTGDDGDGRTVAWLSDGKLIRRLIGAAVPARPTLRPHVLKVHRDGSRCRAPGNRTSAWKVGRIDDLSSIASRAPSGARRRAHRGRGTRRTGRLPRTRKLVTGCVARQVVAVTQRAPPRRRNCRCDRRGGAAAAVSRLETRRMLIAPPGTAGRALKTGARWPGYEPTRPSSARAAGGDQQHPTMRRSSRRPCSDMVSVFLTLAQRMVIVTLYAGRGRRGRGAG